MPPTDRQQEFLTMLIHPAVINIAATTLDRPKTSRCCCWLAVVIAAGLLLLIGRTLK